MLDALRRNETTIDASLIKSQYKVDASAVAEAIIMRAHVVRRLRAEFAAEGSTVQANGTQPLQTKCS